MADKKDDTAADAPKKKGGLMKMLAMAVALIVLVGGGVGAGLYAASSGLVGGGHRKADNGPRLVPKSEQKAPAASEGGGGGSSAEGGPAPGTGGRATPDGEGGERWASTYYPLDKDFTANLQESAHFIQVGIAISTPYDEKEIARIKTNEIAIRSAVLLALGDTTEDQVFTSDGKRQLQARLTKAINATLEQKEGFGGVGNVYFTNFVVQ